MAGISDDVENLRVNRDDFMHALEEVKPAFGVSEEELQAVIQNGIIHFDANIEVSNRNICESLSVSPLLRVRSSTEPQALIHSPPCFRSPSSKTANCSWNKSKCPPVPHWFLSSYMDRQVQGRRHSQRRSLRHLSSLSSSLSLLTAWWVCPRHRKYLLSARSFRTVTRVPSV